MAEFEPIDILNIRSLSKSFNTPTGKFQLFKDFNLDIKDYVDKNQFISILGESGCGKSMLIKMIAGLEDYDSGEMLIHGVDKRKTPHIPMVMQQYSSFSWMTVYDNIALPLKMKGVPKAKIKEVVTGLIDTVGLTGMDKKYASTAQLSGGQLQRVAIARTLATESRIILLDEVTSALDIKMKKQIQQLLLSIYYGSKEDRTFINVTHDIREAVTVSDRVIIMAPGPARIVEDISIDLPGNRQDPDLYSTPKFKEYVDKIEATIRGSKS